jgi:F-type H+-transporting ATPase subunit epsilon
MKVNSMNLKVLLPYQVLLEASGLERIVLDTTQGSVGLLPRRLDCVAILTPGILSYQEAGRPVVYVAIDSGVFIKTGADVSVSVRHAVIGPDLAQLQRVVKEHFLRLDDQERQMKTALAKVESGLVQRFREVLA